MRTFGTIALLLLIICCSEKKRNANEPLSVVSKDSSEMRKIEALLIQYYSDMSKRDWNRYRNHFWPRATITTAWHQPGDATALVDVTTIEDFIKETRNGPDSKPVFEETMTGHELKVKGNIAEAWVEYDAKFGTTDSLMQWSGTDVFTMMRHDDEWKIVSLVFEADH